MTEEEDFLQRHADEIAKELDHQAQLERVKLLPPEHQAEVLKRLEIIRHNENCGFFDKPISEHFDNEDIPSNFGMCIYVVVFIAFIIYCKNRPSGFDRLQPSERQVQQ
jgi:hypothetical protein